MTATRRSSIWRWLLGLGLTVGVAFGLSWIGQWWRLSSQERLGREDLDAACAELDAAAPGWRWDQIEAQRPPRPDGPNAAEVIVRVAGERAQQLEPDFPGELVANRRLDDARLAQMRELVAERADAIALAATLADTPHGWADLGPDADSVSEPPPHVMAARVVVWLLTVDAERLLHENKPREAARHLDAVLHAGAAMRDQGQSLAQLVRIALRSVAANRAERLLGMGELDGPTLARLQAHFAAEANERPALTGLRGERALASVGFTNWAVGKGNFAQKMAAEPGAGRVLQPAMQRGIPGEHAAYLRAMTRVIAVAELPFAEQPAGWAAIEAEALEQRRAAMVQHHGTLAALSVPPFRVVGEAGLRDHAWMQCVTVALAAERYRVDQQRWPETLAELMPKYLASVPLDPYSGQPLLLRRFGDSIAVYSVGKNGSDDGGDRIASKHHGEPGSDLGIRLWDVAHRRLPPEPQKERS